ncbi:uncharacterized protein E0L32_000871 [Thyridium curvatum]|uniref:Uncharacterized protein n=1 Tax=Thyridium curvatum TaxID=1093900 RepID=A0A507B1W8_9PEZI|nr:uncharacterized protein E0L32_000871 [Thyridium curvatum]TPX12694.1 hypothetical protein E0L32_000871 [Thyridium curvatum]
MPSRRSMNLARPPTPSCIVQLRLDGTAVTDTATPHPPHSRHPHTFEDSGVLPFFIPSSGVWSLYPQRDARGKYHGEYAQRPGRPPAPSLLAMLSNRHPTAPVAHRAQHKATCNKIKKARAKLAQEDHGVRNATPDFMTPANAFETDAGRFWGILSTRDYMRARYGLAEYLRLSGTLDGVQEALSHMQDMIRLCRSDNMGLRDLVPALMLRLDLDQECYDFVKWWATCDPDGNYDWGDLTLPHLNLRGADAFEDPNFLGGKFAPLNHTVAILLLKLKILVDVRNLKVTRKVLASHRLPLELCEPVELSVVRSPLSTKLQRLSPESLSRTEENLLDQIRELGAKLVEANKHFMFSLFEPDEPLCDEPEAYSMGSWEEMARAMQSSYAAFWETEGVLDLLNDARACAGRDSENEIDDMMDGETFKSRPGSRRTKEELLADVSVNRIWGYLDYAVENASYLGPWSERPSERHTRENREAWANAIAEDEEDESWSSDED